MSELSFADVIAILVGLSGWIGTYYQGRSVRLAESQQQSQLNSLQDVVNRIEKERNERTQMIEAEAQERHRLVEEAKATLHDDYWELHRLSRDSSGGTRIIHSKHICDLSLCLLFLSNTLLNSDIALDIEQRELIEIIGQLAAAISSYSDTESKFSYDMLKYYEDVQSGQIKDSAHSVKDQYDSQFKKALEERELALGRFYTNLARLKERVIKEG